MVTGKINELKRLAEPLASPNGSDSNASWWDAFHRAANPAAILALIQQRDDLLAALKNARELVDDFDDGSDIPF